MTTTLPSATAATPEPSMWQLWRNPIFLRYCTARLRPKGLLIGGLLVLLISGFMFAIIREPTRMRGSFSMAEAERAAVIPLIIFQAFLLFVLGTAQASGGMISEADEGVIDYQRLLPLRPATKVFGFLFGLPVREWVLFLVPMPFTIWGFWKGQVPLHVFTSIYGAMISSGIAYHLTGLLIGTVVKNRRWAFLSAIGFIFLLYTVIPQLGRFGLTTFQYLSISPVIEQNYPYFAPDRFQKATEMIVKLTQQAPFFGLKFHAVWFTLFCQAGLSAALFLMLYRRWRKTESLLLGKLSAVFFNIWLHIQFLGNALPLIPTGEVFPSREFRRLAMMGNWEPSRTEALAVSIVYALMTVCLSALLINLCTPDREMQRRAWRRARKYGHRRLRFLGDAATSFWSTLLIALTGAAAWFVFTKNVIESQHFKGFFLQTQDAVLIIGLMVALCVAFQAVLESAGRGKLGILMIVIGAVPLMVAAVMAASSDSLNSTAQWIAGASPLTLLPFGIVSQLDPATLPRAMSRSLPLVFQFWAVVHTLAAAWWVKHLYVSRRDIRNEGAL